MCRFPIRKISILRVKEMVPITRKKQFIKNSLKHERWLNKHTQKFLKAYY